MAKYFIIIPLLAASLAASAQAQELSARVGYADLDLASDAGVARFDQRIDAAVEQVCGDRLGQQALSATMAIRKCSRDTRAGVAAPREVAIARARGKLPSVELAEARSAGASALLVRRR